MGVAERKHQHLSQVARAIRFQAKVPIEFWDYCVMCATHIINRTQSRRLGNKTPFEKLYGKTPSYEDMRVFGCKVFYHNNNQNNKFDQRSNVGC